MEYGSINPELLGLAANRFRKLQLVKNAFVPGGDPAMGGAPPQDPAAQGMDPSMMGGGMPPGGGGMDPSMMGGGMPPGGGAPDMGALISQISQQVIQQITPMLGQGGGGAGGAGGAAGGGLKPKVDVNVAIVQILKILARISDALGVPIPASELIVSPQDLNQYSQQQTAAAAPAQQASAIQPVSPMTPALPGGGQKQAKDYVDVGEEYAYEQTANNHQQLSDKAAAIMRLRKTK